MRVSEIDDRWLQITAGRCPAECQWVVNRLVTHITRYCSKQGVRVSLVHSVQGDQSATLKSALLRVQGSAQETCLERFRGTVLWRGKSLYRPYHKRKNWYVGVDVLSVAETASGYADLKNLQQEIDVQSIRATGPGGQNVNCRESAVRITHRLTGVSVVGREERSQEMNRRLAFARLQQRLLEQQQHQQHDLDRERWRQHNQLERGNPVLIFEGKEFQEVMQ